jgi:hypothetical protein
MPHSLKILAPAARLAWLVEQMKNGLLLRRHLTPSLIGCRCTSKALMRDWNHLIGTVGAVYCCSHANSAVEYTHVLLYRDTY